VLLAERAVAAAALARAAAQLRDAEVRERARIAPLRSERDARAGKLADAERRVAGLQARAGVAGRWVPQPGTELDGSHVRRGAVLGYIVNGPSAVVRSAVPQEDLALIRNRLRGVEVRLAQAMPVVLPARVAREVPGGEFQLVSPALGTSGGGELAVDPARPEGTRTLRRVFDLELALDGTSPTAVFGDRAHVRFDLGLAPLGWQWFLRLRQLFLARLNV
jgi:putative peptide zinc metalloprotease protein